MSAEMIVSLCAVVVSLISLGFGIWSWEKQKNVSAVNTFLAAIAQVERTLGLVSTAVRFHGIKPEELEEIGVTSEEFAYLVESFAVGWIRHYSMTPTDSAPWVEGSYRFNMLSSEATRKAWPLIKRMMGPGKYCEKVEATLKVCETVASSPNRLQKDSKV